MPTPERYIPPFTIRVHEGRAYKCDPICCVCYSYIEECENDMGRCSALTVW